MSFTIIQIIVPKTLTRTEIPNERLGLPRFIGFRVPNSHAYVGTCTINLQDVLLHSLRFYFIQTNKHIYNIYT